ncbi:hypothetical protein Mucpa_4133 [Mucilaginibacter paludis DSM 18603]|uniref:Uncharacterized protein n=1 Tax=Mucilaginibacter paludis DSM 18603 TaxID=714943 RepID=H1Y2P5_9SPHI|nr:hypothetical protein Mucpa_4133 [Mucilaginibacter paludis DSM 18603]
MGYGVIFFLFIGQHFVNTSAGNMTNARFGSVFEACSKLNHSIQQY